MASKRRLRRNACDRKKRYDTREIAIGQMHALIKRLKGQIGRLNVYGCSTCGGFHVGHRQKPRW